VCEKEKEERRKNLSVLKNLDLYRVVYFNYICE
jgi:hypothetical protein